MILLYRRLLSRTGDIVKKTPITLYRRVLPGEHEMRHFQDPYILLRCHQLIASAHDVLTSNNSRQ